MISEEQFLKDLRELLETDEDITMDTDLLEIDSPEDVEYFEQLANSSPWQKKNTE